MTFLLRAKLAFWRFIALFEGRFGPHVLAVVVLTLGVCLVAAGLALAEAVLLLPPPAFLEDLIDEATSQVFRARVTADV